MKNAILISSAICSIFMIWFINLSTKSMNASKDKEMEPVNEWMEDITEQQDAIITEEAEKEAAKILFSQRMRELSRKQESITTDLAKEFTTAFEKQPGGDSLGSDPKNMDPTGLTVLNNLIRRQSEIMNEFKRLKFDLSEHLQGIADQRHIDTLESINKSDAFAQLENIRSSLMQNQSFKAAEQSKLWAGKMTQWAQQLDTE